MIYRLESTPYGEWPALMEDGIWRLELKPIIFRDDLLESIRSQLHTSAK